MIINNKKQKTDPDDRFIKKLLVGLSGLLVILIAGLVIANVLETDNSIKASRAVDQSSTAAQAPPSQTEQALQNDAGLTAAMKQLNAWEGERSTFNPDQEYEPGEILLADPPVGFEDKIRPEGFIVIEHINLSRLGMRLVRVRTPPGMSVPNGIRRLGALLPGVSIDANHSFDQSGQTVALLGGNPREMAGWVDLSPTCGTGLVLGQIDSGVDTTHPALVGQKVHYQAFSKNGRSPGSSDHGTSIAAMLVGKSEWGGLLPGAELFAANMFEINEKGKQVGSTVGLLQSVDWLASKHVNAVNLSVAGSDNKVVRKAFDLAKKYNLLMIAAVGNWGRSDKPAYPAAYDHVVAVTATKGTELIYSHANQGDYVDFAAPGVGIYTALPGGGGKPQSGTSFASPYITAMAAILAQAGKTPDAASLRALLSKATRDLGKPGKDDIFGYGYVKVRPSCR